MKINFKNFFMGFILILLLISALNIVSAYDIDLMEIEGGCISTGGGLEDKTYAIIYVGEEYSGADVLIQIFYSRDGSQLNPEIRFKKLLMILVALKFEVQMHLNISLILQKLIYMILMVI